MSSTLYKEALLEVEALKRMAEENAKNKIIDAVTPQIRNLIEAQLLGEKKVDELDDFLDSENLDDPETQELDMATLQEPELEFAAPLDIPVPEVIPKTDAPKIKIDVQGDINIEMENDDPEIDQTYDDLILGQEASDVVEGYILGKRSSKFRIRELAKKTRNLSRVLETANLANFNDPRSKIALLYYAKLLDEAVSLATSGIIIEESVDLRLLSQLKITIKEIRHMANRRDAVAFRRLLEELEADESLKEIIGEEDEALDADGEEESAPVSTDIDVDAAKEEAEVLQGTVDSLLDALGLASGDDSDEEDEGIPADDEDELVVDEEVLELEADHKEVDSGLDEIYEIDETMLRRELLRMKEGLEAEKGDPAADESHIGDPLDAQEDFGGSDEVIEVSEEDLIEALHTELNRARRTRRAPSHKRMSESRRKRATARRRNTRNGSSATKQIHEANQKLRTQLHEMNVFNAKLLFANKLMQNRGLTKSQQRAIVEALDSAKTVNEAKLLYKSLSKSLSNRGNLSESKSRLLASSSRSTRSASPASNRADGDRWAILAGLTEKNK